MQFSQRLDEIEARFDELTRQMADPAVIADGDTYRKIAKARSELEETVNQYREYKQAKRNYDEAPPNAGGSRPRAAPDGQR